MDGSHSVKIDVDPFSQKFRANPKAYHAELLRASPAYIDAEGVTAVVVATYAQNVAVLRDFKTFASTKPPGTPGMQKFDFFNGLPVMNYSDPPDHTRRRRVASPAFNPRRVAQLAQLIKPKVDELLDEAIAHGEFDAVADVGRKFSIDLLLNHFLNIDPADQHIFLKFASTLPLLDALQPGDPKPAPYREAWDAGVAYCREATQRALRDKTDNLIGLIATSTEGGALNDDEMMAMMVVLLTGGINTVGAIAASALAYLAKNPDIAARIRQDPTLAARHLEETLRMDAPVTFVMRFAAADTTFEGLAIAKDMPVYTMISVACHDPAAFPDPGRFDIDRPNVKDQVAFGLGAHTCIGNTITRIAAPVLIEAAAKRLPNLHVADRPDAITYESRTARARHALRMVLAA